MLTDCPIQAFVHLWQLITSVWSGVTWVKLAKTLKQACVHALRKAPLAFCLGTVEFDVMLASHAGVS